MNKLLDEIAYKLGFEYDSINNFLEKIILLNYETQIIIFDDLVRYKSLFNKDFRELSIITPEVLNNVFKATKKILNMIKIHIGEYKGNFSTGFEQLRMNKQNLVENLSSNKILNNQIQTFNYENYTAVSEDPFIKLKNFINELYNSQKKRNK
jgi:hypothetical protein